MDSFFAPFFLQLKVPFHICLLVNNTANLYHLTLNIILQ